MTPTPIAIGAPGRRLVLSVVVFCCSADVFFSDGNELTAFGCCSGLSGVGLPRALKGEMLSVIVLRCCSGLSGASLPPAPPAVGGINAGEMLSRRAGKELFLLAVAVLMSLSVVATRTLRLVVVLCCGGG